MYYVCEVCKWAHLVNGFSPELLSHAVVTRLYCLIVKHQNSKTIGVTRQTLQQGNIPNLVVSISYSVVNINLWPFSGPRRSQDSCNIWDVEKSCYNLQPMSRMKRGGMNPHIEVAGTYTIEYKHTWVNIRQA